MSQEICLLQSVLVLVFLLYPIQVIYNVEAIKQSLASDYSIIHAKRISLSTRDSEHHLSIKGQIGLAHIVLTFFLRK